nr:uncharacterized protein LOC111425538 [Onthophagus taurus]
MLSLLTFSTLFFAVTQGGLVRVPKIYNALISSDENLTPSHAYPIIEPVFRTTALGVAFPPIVVNNQPKEGDEIPPKSDKKPEVPDNVEALQKKDTPQLSYHGTLYPVTYDPFFQYAYRNDYLFPALPYIQPHPVYVDMKRIETKKEEREEPVKPAVNFEKNPEVPDVPPPSIPFREKPQKPKSR